MAEALKTALALHQAGHLHEAARCYATILRNEPAHADALHLFGLVHHELGRHAAAVELIGRALVSKPTVAAYHANLAEAYRALGESDRAADCCREALALKPDFAEARCNLGLCLQALARWDEAVEQFEHALRLRPDFATVHNNLGAVLRELGRLEQACEHFRRAIELEPSLALAHSNLGQSLLDRGLAKEALPHSQEAVRLQPQLAHLRHNLGNVLVALKRSEEAKAAYEESLLLDARLSRTHAALGRLLFDQGDLDAALARLRQAVDLDPRHAAFWRDLGDLHEERDDDAEATACYRRALALEPDSVEAHHALGRMLQSAGSYADAAEHFRAAMKLRPDSSQAHLNLGELHEELGELEQAEACFRAALRLQPPLAGPHARLATLLRGKLPDTDLEALQARLADPEVGREGRSNLLFGLAQVLDAREDYARAAACLREANALAIERARERNRAYDAAEHEVLVDTLVTQCGAAFFERLRGAGLTTKRPVFVFGLPRSGTTLVEQVLASHSQVFGAGELRLAWRTFTSLPHVLARRDPPRACLAHVDAATVRRLARRHLEWLAGLGGDRQRTVDKMPDNYQYLGMLAAMFPHAAFIHCRRDFRDVAVSCWMTNFRVIRWANEPRHIAARFQQYQRLMDHWRRVLPVEVHEVDYEELVADLEGVARRLAAACGLEWQPACLDFHRTRRPVRTASLTQVRQPIYVRSVARWRNYEQYLHELFARLPVASET